MEKPWEDHALAFIAYVDEVKFYSNEGPIQPSWKVFETKKEAEEAVANRKEDWDREWRRHQEAIRTPILKDVELDHDHSKCRGIFIRCPGTEKNRFFHSLHDPLRRKLPDYGPMREGFLMLLLAIAGEENVSMESKEYALKGWKIWQAGYGVLCDIDGVYYCYKKA